MLSLTCTYAIRALTFLATQNPEETTLSSLISEKTGVPLAYLSKILLVMKEQGLLDSLKGPGGGFFFVIEPKDIPIETIVQLFDQEILRKDKCVMRIADCHEHCPCPIHDTWGPFRDRFHKILEVTSIGTLATEVLEKRAFLTDKVADKGLSRRRGRK